MFLFANILSEVRISDQIVFLFQGWVFAMAKSIFARTVEKPVKTGKNWQKPAKTGTYKIVQKHPNLGN